MFRKASSSSERAVEKAAPGHVTTVRELIVDALNPDQLTHLRATHERILDRLDPAATTRPDWLDT